MTPNGIVLSADQSPAGVRGAAPRRFTGGRPMGRTDDRLTIALVQGAWP
ncbi:hypothetical protein NJ7G_3485 [Natrinema sp. J7-2]|nr:hypothetical protein NJ7G_3485 [Natrinema sp. J7-2]